MRLKFITAAVLSSLLASGCALSDFSSKTMPQRARDGVRDAMHSVAKEGPAQQDAVNSIDEPYLAFQRTKAPRLDGSLTLNAASAPFGPLLMDTAKKAGYSVVFADNVEAMRKVTVDFNQADPEQAIRQMAFLAGYVAVLDKNNRTFTVADVATITYKLPTSIFQKLSSEYSVGGNPVAQANSSSGSGSGSSGSSSGSGSGSSGSSGSSMQASFTINGKEAASADAVRKLVTNIAGKNSEVEVSEIGIVTVRSNAQALRRVDQFLQSYIKDELTEVDIEASIIEVDLTDDFQFSTNLNKALGNTQSGFGNLVSTLTGPTMVNPATSSLSFTTKSISAVVQAMRTLGDTRVVSQPHVIAVNDTPSSFFDGTQLPYLGSVTSTTTGTQGTAQTSGSTSYATDGVSFSVQPHVLDEQHVQLTLIPVISTVQKMDTFTLGNDGGTLTAPEQVNKQSFMKVIAESGKTLVLAGIRFTNDQKSNSPSLLPILPVGASRNAEGREVVILLRSNIIPAPTFDPIVAESI